MSKVTQTAEPEATDDRLATLERELEALRAGQAGEREAKFRALQPAEPPQPAKDSWAAEQLQLQEQARQQRRRAAEERGAAHERHLERVRPQVAKLEEQLRVITARRDAEQSRRDETLAKIAAEAQRVRDKLNKLTAPEPLPDAVPVGYRNVYPAKTVAERLFGHPQPPRQDPAGW